MTSKFNKDYAIPWIKKAGIQLVPVALIYLTPIIAELSEVGHVFHWSVFVPTNITIGAIILYLVNRIYDALQR